MLFSRFPSLVADWLFACGQLRLIQGVQEDTDRIIEQMLKRFIKDKGLATLVCLTTTHTHTHTHTPPQVLGVENQSVHRS